jgi:hypothetical protein
MRKMETYGIGSSIVLMLLLLLLPCVALAQDQGESALLLVGGGSTPTFVQGKSSGTANALTVAFSSSVTAGNAIVVGVYSGNGGGQSITFTDSQGNAFTTAASVSLATDDDTIAVGCAIAGSTGSDTITFHTAGGASRGTAYEFSGVTCTQDVTAKSSNTTGATSCNSGSMTTSTANDLLIGFCGTDGTQTTAIAGGSGWSNVLNASNGGSVFLMSESRTATTPGPFTATSGTISVQEQAAVLVAYKSH